MIIVVLPVLPTLQFTVHDDGTWAVASPWHPVVPFAQSFLSHPIEEARGRFAVRGDELSIRCTNGGAVYALGPLDGGSRRGVLMRAWAC